MSEIATKVAGGGTSLAEQVKEFYEALSRDITGDEPAEVVIDRHHTPDVLEMSDGITIDRQRLVDHVAPLRKQGFRPGPVEVHEAIGGVTAAGGDVAARLTVTGRLRKRDVVTDIHLFASFADDGRLRRAHILTRPV